MSGLLTRLARFKSGPPAGGFGRAGVSRGYAQQRGGGKPFGFRSEEEEARRKENLRRQELGRKEGDGTFLERFVSAFIFSLSFVLITNWAHKWFFPEHYAKLVKKSEERQKGNKTEAANSLEEPRVEETDVGEGQAEAA